MKAWGRGNDWLKWVAAGFALVATASAEYELARAIGMNQFIAAAVPGALDAYAVRALRSHREVLTAVLAMVGVNAASHLVTAGVLHVDWILITAVSAIAPLVLWRVHALSTPGEARVSALWGVTEGEHGSVLGYSIPSTGVTVEGPHPDPALWTEHTSTPPVPEHAPVSTDTCPYCDMPGVLMSEHIGTCSRWAHVPEHEPSTAQEEIRAQTEAWGDDWNEHAEEAVLAARWDVCAHGHLECEGHGGECIIHTSTAPTIPCPLCSYVGDRLREHVEVEHPSTPSVLHLVPPLPDTFPASTFTDTVTEHVRTGVLLPSDTAFMERARVLAGQTQGVPGVRAIKTELSTGTARAQRLCAALTIEHEKEEQS